jgi:hypothetical protein
LEKLADAVRKEHWRECDKCEPSNHLACRVCLKARFVMFIRNWRPKL